MKNTFKIIPFLIAGFLWSQTIEIGNTTLNTGGSGVTGTLTTNETYRFQHTVSVGEPFIGTVDLGAAGAMSLGQFSYYDQQTNVPTVTASEGDYPDQVKVGWSVAVLQPPIQNGVRIYRNGELIAQFGYGVTEWIDNNVFPGEIYLYEVQAENHYGWGIVGEAAGFVNPNGRITGKVQTNHQTPVYGVEVVLSPYFGKTLEFDGNGDYIEILDFPNDVFTDNTYTIEFWMKVNNHVNGFPIEKWNVQGATDNAFLINDNGAFLSAGETTSLPVPPSTDEWHHLSYVMNAGTLSIYLDSLKVAEASGHHSNTTEYPIVIGNNRDGNYDFDGHLDEVRIWNTTRDSAQIIDNMHRVVDSDSEGLVAEWRFDEGIGSKVFDITDASYDGHITGASWSDDNPDIHNSAFTDMDGNYSIRGIFYEPAGTEFTVTPQKAWHIFTPENKTATLSTSSTASDGVDFMDNSQITVSGYINFYNTFCYEDGVEIKEVIEHEDGTKDTVSLQPPVLTDGDGHYICEFEPGTSHRLIPQLGDHLFIPAFYETGLISMPQANKNFEDYETYRLLGSISGGDCRLPLGEEFQVIISTEPSCYADTVIAQTNGNYEFNNLPARHYEVSVYSENPYFDFTGQQANLTFGNDTIDFVWREPLQAEFSVLPSGCGEFDHIVHQGKPDSVYFSVFEEYNGVRCYLDTVFATITDNFSDTTYEASAVLGENGTVPVYYTPAEPNLLEGGEHPYQKNLEVTVMDKFEREASDEFWAVITGAQAIPNNQFTTSTSEMPWFVLRNPPGDGSYTYFTDEMETCTNMKLYEVDGFGNQAKGTLHAGVELTMIVGFGTMIENTQSVKFDAGYGYHANVTTTDVDENCLCFQRSQTYSTSGDGVILGDDATVFVGGGLTMTFGIARDLQINSCEVEIDTILTSNITGLNSTYMFSKYYIKNELMPLLWMQWIEDSDSTHLESYNYWTAILAIDSLAIVNAVQSSVYNVGTEEHNSNISFDAGASLEFHTSTTRTKSHSHKVKIEDSHQAFGETGATLNGFGFSYAYAHTWYSEDESEEKHDTTHTEITGFVLGDDDPGDAYTVNVLQETTWGTPVFELAGGQSKCPWQEGTLRRQKTNISINPSIAINVEPDDQAQFTVTLGNDSETGEDWEYILRVLNDTNPDAAILKVGGQPMGSATFPYTIHAGEQIDLIISVERGPVEYEYEDIELILYSGCEWDLWEEHGIPIAEGLADTVAFSVHFIEPCGGQVNIAYPDENWVCNDSTMSFTVNGYNHFDPASNLILMEYQHSTDGMLFVDGNPNESQPLPQGALAMTLDGWFIADTIFVESLTENYFQWSWDVSFMDDGPYEVRAVGECDDHTLVPSEPIAGILDREGPKVFGEMHPIDGVLNADDEIKLVFEEAIDCDYLFPNQLHLYNESFGMDVAMDFDCFENEIIIVPDIQNSFIENCYLKLTIDELWDLHGNKTESPIVFEFFVDQNAIHWNQNLISDVVFMGEEKTITTTLHNRGTEASSFVFSGQPWFLDQQTTPIPWWIDVNPTQGDLNPGGEYPVEITISGMLNLGEYEEIFYAHTNNGDEPLEISVRSLCPPPVWELDEQAFQHSMNLSCQVSVKDEISTDDYDFVGAFVNDECRGYAPIEHILLLSEPYDSTWTDDNGIEHTHSFVDTLMNKYMGFMTVHSDVQSNEDVYFHLWDASNCEEYWEIDQSFPFVANSVLGNPETPIVLNATGAVAQFITMEEGWTWFSVHLNHNEEWLNINNIFSHKEHFNGGDRIISQGSVEVYSESASQWMPGTMQINPSEMYMAHLATVTPATFIGHEINPDSLEIEIYPSWNWLGYPLRFNHTVNEALQNLEATNESTIKNETQFAEYMSSIGLWVGSLQWMTPGHGYLYESTSNDPITFTYAGLDAEQGDGLARMNIATETEPIESPWILNTNDYRFNMPIVCELNSNEWDIENILILVIVGEEVRGIAQPVYEPALDKWRVYLMTHSNRANGETLRFRIYDGESNTEYSTNQIATFDESGRVGTVSNPIPLTKASAVIPEKFVLSQIYPNPFNPTTTIQFGVPDASDVKLHVYDILGREVVTLVNGQLDAGYHTISWNGKDKHGKSISSGIYFTVMQSGSFRDVKKMVMLK